MSPPNLATRFYYTQENSKVNYKSRMPDEHEVFKENFAVLWIGFNKIDMIKVKIS